MCREAGLGVDFGHPYAHSSWLHLKGPLGALQLSPHKVRIKRESESLDSVFHSAPETLLSRGHLGKPPHIFQPWWGIRVISGRCHNFILQVINFRLVESMVYLHEDMHSCCISEPIKPRHECPKHTDFLSCRLTYVSPVGIS